MEEITDKKTINTLFKVNQRLEINIDEKQGNVKSYKSRVEEVQSAHLVIAMPMSHGAVISLREGDYFQAKLIIGQLGYQFTSKFISRRLAPLPVWIIAWPSSVTKVQQRSFVRMGVVLPAQVVIKDPDGGEPERLEVLTRDISGGGLEVVLEKRLPHGMQVLVLMKLPGEGAISIVGEVARVHKPLEDREIFWTGIRFIDIQERDRDCIIRYIFKKQLETRRKENRV